MRYLLRKLMFLLLTAWAALTINFFLPHMMPGDPVQVMIAKFQGRLSPQAIDALTKAFGLNTGQSLLFDYFDYWGRIFSGDLGYSLTYYPSRVTEVLAGAIPWTIVLVGLATIIAFLFGTTFGIFSAWNRNSKLADISVPIALFLNSVPYFWIALLILYIFGFKLGWFPIGGGYDVFSAMTEWGKYKSIMSHAILPLSTIIITAMGGWLLTMRNNMISVMSDDYITYAKAKGLSDKRIKYKYAARNAILPSFTAFAMSLGFVIGGSLLTEVVFSYPGLGYTLYQAVTSLDYPLMQAIFLIISIAVLIANFITDFIYVLLDPRVSGGGE